MSSSAKVTSDWQDFFPEELIPEVISLVRDTWASMPRGFGGVIENQITEALYSEIKRTKEAAELPVLIILEHHVFKGRARKSIGRIDIVVYAGKKETVYFSLECKRLNVRSGKRISSLAREYVEEGMHRYISEKYAEGLLHGGMVAYVMDSNVPSASGAVQKMMAKLQTSLHLASAGVYLEPNKMFLGVSDVNESNHKLKSKNLKLHHVFLGI